MTHLTTHVLDATTGRPAAGIDVRLTTAAGDPLATGTTGADGRLGLGPDRLAAGDYTLVFATGAYFAATGTAAFHPVVAVTFAVPESEDAEPHCHVPLLLSPFAYSTYRGS